MIRYCCSIISWIKKDLLLSHILSQEALTTTFYVQWWFVKPDTFVLGQYFRINEFSGLLNRPLVRTRISVPPLFVPTSEISGLSEPGLTNHHCILYSLHDLCWHCLQTRRRWKGNQDIFVKHLSPPLNQVWKWLWFWTNNLPSDKCINVPMLKCMGLSVLQLQVAQL